MNMKEVILNLIMTFYQINFDKNIIREKGRVLIFPSFLPHKVTPVTKGVRKSLVTWMEGPAWR